MENNNCNAKNGYSFDFMAEMLPLLSVGAIQHTTLTDKELELVQAFPKDSELLHSYRYTLFLCHRGEMKHLAIQIHKALLDLNYTSFVDTFSFHPGQNNRRELYELVIPRVTFGAVIILSDAFLESTWCIEEFQLLTERALKYNNFYLFVLDCTTKELVFGDNLKFKWTPASGETENISLRKINPTIVDAMKELQPFLKEKMCPTDVKKMHCTRCQAEVCVTKKVKYIIDTPTRLVGQYICSNFHIVKQTGYVSNLNSALRMAELDNEPHPEMKLTEGVTIHEEEELLSICKLTDILQAIPTFRPMQELIKAPNLISALHKLIDLTLSDLPENDDRYQTMKIISCILSQYASVFPILTFGMLLPIAQVIQDNLLSFCSGNIDTTSMTPQRAPELFETLLNLPIWPKSMLCDTQGQISTVTFMKIFPRVLGQRMTAHHQKQYKHQKYELRLFYNRDFKRYFQQFVANAQKAFSRLKEEQSDALMPFFEATDDWHKIGSFQGYYEEMFGEISSIQWQNSCQFDFFIHVLPNQPQAVDFAQELMKTMQSFGFRVKLIGIVEEVKISPAEDNTQHEQKSESVSIDENPAQEKDSRMCDILLVTGNDDDLQAIEDTFSWILEAPDDPERAFMPIFFKETDDTAKHFTIDPQQCVLKFLCTRSGLEYKIRIFKDETRQDFIGRIMDLVLAKPFECYRTFFNIGRRYQIKEQIRLFITVSTGEVDGMDLWVQSEIKVPCCKSNFTIISSDLRVNLEEARIDVTEKLARYQCQQRTDGN